MTALWHGILSRRRPHCGCGAAIQDVLKFIEALHCVKKDAVVLLGLDGVQHKLEDSIRIPQLYVPVVIQGNFNDVVRRDAALEQVVMEQVKQPPSFAPASARLSFFPKGSC